MSTLEYIPIYERQRERRQSLEQELHLAEAVSVQDALPEGFNVNEQNDLEDKKRRKYNWKNILSIVLCCQPV